MRAARYTILSTLLILSVNMVPLYGSHSGAKVYLLPQSGFEVYLAAAFTKKHIPVTIVGDAEQADYVLEAAPIEHKPESTGGKIARCLFAYCMGMDGIDSASVRLIDQKTKVTVWSYTSDKSYLYQREQSLAESIAKHFKSDFIAK